MTLLSKRHFWEWFKRHHSEFVTLNNKSKKEAAYWLNELNTHLRAYFKCLRYSLEWIPGQTATLTITVYGKARHFKKADDLMSKAPYIPGWNFVALEDPRPIDFLLDREMQASGIDPLEFRFSLATNGPNETLLIVYHPLYTPENEDLLQRIANKAVYNLLGERSFGTDISRIEVANLSSADATDLETLEALPECMDLPRSGIVVDGGGDWCLGLREVTCRVERL